MKEGRREGGREGRKEGRRSPNDEVDELPFMRTASSYERAAWSAFAAMPSVGRARFQVMAGLRIGAEKVRDDRSSVLILHPVSQFPVRISENPATTRQMQPGLGPRPRGIARRGHRSHEIVDHRGDSIQCVHRIQCRDQR